jgi:DNA-binding GntR family transcriptional regulator
MQYAITRSRIRDQIKALLSTMIQEGALRSAQHLDEVGLSQRLGVSRTPLREALIALESDGLVRSIPNKGFVVVDANRALVREVFPIRPGAGRIERSIGKVRRAGRTICD